MGDGTHEVKQSHIRKFFETAQVYTELVRADFDDHWKQLKRLTLNSSHGLDENGVAVDHTLTCQCRRFLSAQEAYQRNCASFLQSLKDAGNTIEAGPLCVAVVSVASSVTITIPVVFDRARAEIPDINYMWNIISRLLLPEDFTVKSKNILNGLYLSRITLCDFCPPEEVVREHDFTVFLNDRALLFEEKVGDRRRMTLRFPLNNEGDIGVIGCDADKQAPPEPIRKKEMVILPFIASSSPTVYDVSAWA